MTQQAYTEGPWEVTCEGPEEFWFGGGYWYIRPVGVPVPIDCESDARLIAAAPQLLDACEALVTYRETGKATDSARAFALAKAAIAQARGADAEGAGS